MLLSGKITRQFWLKITLQFLFKPVRTMSDKPSQKRKREAATDLRALAGELQLNDRGRNADLNATGFSNLFRPVVASCTTPEQKRRAQGARDKYDGTHVTLPTLPQFPGSAAAPAACASQVQLPRLGSGQCM